MPEIPIIDFADVFDSGTNEAVWAAKAEEIREACHSIGFMYIVNHGIPQETVGLFRLMLNPCCCSQFLNRNFFCILDSSGFQWKQAIF